MQWWIQDFPLGGRQPIGGAPTSDVCTFPLKHMRKQNKLILLGGGGRRRRPPGSANGMTLQFYLVTVFEYRQRFLLRKNAFIYYLYVTG